LNNINTVIFDLGGVLISWDPKRLYRKIFEEEEKMDWFLENVCDMPWNEEQDAGRSLAEATVTKIQEYPEYAEYIKAYYSRWEEMLGGPIEETVEVLAALSKNPSIRLLALTNWSAETFPIAIERYDFLGLFEGIVVSGVEKTRKPFADIYHLLLDRYNVIPSEAIFIDDNERNVQAAKGLGIGGIHFKTAQSLKSELNQRGIL